MTATADSKGLPKAIPLAAFQELVGQYHHRLLSLEAELREQARGGAVPPSVFARRVERLKEVHRDLQDFQRLCQAGDAGALTGADVGLPLLESCTPAERQVCEAYLLQKDLDTQAFAEESGRVLKWLTEAVSGRLGPLRLTLRLSRLRRLLQAMERRSEAMNRASQSLAVHVDRLLASVKGETARAAGRSTLDGLMALFQQLDLTIARIARLRACTKSEQARVQAMDAWLKQEEERLAAAEPPMAAPTPLAVSQALASAGVQERMSRRRRRRDLIEQYWDEVVHGGAATASGDGVAAAAAVLRLSLTGRRSRPRPARGRG